MDTSERLTCLPSPMSSSVTPPSKCSPAVSFVFSPPLNAYGRRQAFGLYTSSLENGAFSGLEGLDLSSVLAAPSQYGKIADLNRTVNSCHPLDGKAVVRPDLQLCATKENNMTDSPYEPEEAVSMSSQSGSLSGSSEDTDSSSDPENLEEEEEEEDDPSDGSDATDSDKDYKLTKKLPRLTHSTYDTPKKNPGSTAIDMDTTTGQRNRSCVPLISAHPPNPLLSKPSEEQHLRINPDMKEQDWWFSLKSKTSSLSNPLFLSSKSPPLSVLPTLPPQKLSHNARLSVSSSIDMARNMTSWGLHVDSSALKRLVSKSDSSTQAQDVHVKNSTSQSSSLSSLSRVFESSPAKNKTAPLFNSHTNGLTQDAPLALVVQPRNPTNSPVAPCSQFPMPINYLSSKQPPSISPYKGTSGLMCQALCKLNGQNKTDKIKTEDSDDSLIDGNDTEDASSNTSDSSSSVGVTFESSDDAKGNRETSSDGYRTPQKHNKQLQSSPSPSANYSLLKTSCLTLDSCGNVMTRLETLKNHSSNIVFSTPASLPVQRRRVTDEKALRVPLDFGWQRVTRVRAEAGRLQGEVCYYAPCGKKLRLYPDVLKYLLRNGITEISRDNFSFSTKIHLGEFYQAREGPEGLQWLPLAEEEIAPCIIAMDGRRQRKAQGQHTHSLQPLVHSPDSADAKLLRKLEAQEIARQATQMKIMKNLERQARAQAAKEAKKQRAILAAEEKRKKKEQLKILKQQEKIRRIQQIRLEKEVRAQQILEAKRKKKEEAANAKILKAEKRSQEREMRRQHAILQKHQVMELHRLDIVWEKERRRQHLMLLKEAEARKKAEEKERLKKERNDEKLLNKERKLELRRLELQELKKPREDQCLTDHKPLPDLSHIPGLVLSGRAFSDCLMVLQFVHRFGKVLSLNTLSLSELQGGLLNMTDCVDKVQKLLVNMVSAAVGDPNLPHTHKMKTALGELLSNVKLDSDNVSEALRIYMENHCDPDSYLNILALSLRTKDFRALHPSEKTAILAYLVNKLCCCKAVVSEIDKNIDHMAGLRKEKWIVEGALRKLRRIHAKKTGMKVAEGTQNCDNLAATNKRKRKEAESEEDEDEEEESDDEEDEEAEEEEGKKAKRIEEDDNIHSASVEELEKQIEKVAKQKTELRQKLLEASYSLRSMMLGQDRYRRSYWLLPECGGVFVEGMESEQFCPGHEDILSEKRHSTGQETPLKEEDVDREAKTTTDSNLSIHNNLREPINSNADHSPLDSTHFPSPKFKNSSWTSASVPLHHKSSVFVNQWISNLPPPCTKPIVNTSPVPSSCSSQTPPSALISSAYSSTEDGDMQQQYAQSGTHHGGGILCDMSRELTSSGLPFAGSSVPPTRDLTSQHARGNANGAPFQTSHLSVSNTQPTAPSTDSPTPAPSSHPAEDVALHQEHSNPTPVPKDMLHGWWWMPNVEELNHLCKALHCRGIREKALAKQIQKNTEYLAQIYNHKDDAVIDVVKLEKQAYCKEMVDQWCVQKQAMKWDIRALRQVEEWESRVISASLQVKDWTPPKPQSQWEDLLYHEHKSSSSPALLSPLDTAVSRLAELERNIDRRKEEEDSPWRRLWHKALSEVHSSAQLVLCIQQLQNNIPWHRAITKTECQICHSGDNEELLLLCDGCDKGCHVYCHKPKINSIPEGDWFCPVCSNKTTSGFVIQQSVQSLQTQTHPSPTSGGGKRASEGKPSGKPSVSGELIKEETASRSSSTPRKSIKEGKKRKADSGTSGSKTKRDPPVSKKAKMRDGGTDELDVCQQLLGELETHQDAWPFLKPVNPKSVPGYKKVVKKPMDLSTIREKIANKQYSCLESFTDDVNLVFDNCERFNEDDSEIGKAGHIMRRFFNKRRAELLK